MKACFLLIICFAAFHTHAQYYFKPEEKPREFDKISFGIGVGLDYGGIGGSFLVYPHKNIGLFAGGGYALAGFGYNIGSKIRIITASRVHPFVTAMYGYNTAIYVTNATQYNKLFYGTTFGFGIDLRTKYDKYFTFALLIPMRGSDVDNYMNNLRSQGISFDNSLPPIAVSVGYRFTLE